MEKKYKLIYHFRDGVTWGTEAFDSNVTSKEVQFLLDELNKGNKIIGLDSTREEKSASEIKSIEILF